MDAMAAQLRIQDITKDGRLQVERLEELRNLVKHVYHESALRDVIFPLIDFIQENHKTVKKGT
jgi:hypothetical protein